MMKGIHRPASPTVLQGHGLGSHAKFEPLADQISKSRVDGVRGFVQERLKRGRYYDVQELVDGARESALVGMELAHALGSRNAFVRANAALAIGEARRNGLPMPEAIRPLAKLLAKEDMIFIGARREAADALARMAEHGDDIRVAEGALLTGVAYDDNMLRSKCRQVLARMDAQGKLSEGAKGKIAGLDIWQDARHLLCSYLPEDADRGIALVIAHEAAREETVRLLSDHSRDARENAALALGRAAMKNAKMPSGAVEALAHLIVHHEKTYIRAAQNAAFALWQMALSGQDIEGARRSLNHAANLKHEADHELRMMCLNALGAMETQAERKMRTPERIQEIVHGILRPQRE